MAYCNQEWIQGSNPAVDRISNRLNQIQSETQRYPVEK